MYGNAVMIFRISGAVLPLQISMLVLIPQLYGIDDILPYDIGARSNDGDGIEEGVHEPDAHDIVLLAQSLTAIDILAPDAADGLADAEEDDAHHERKEEQQEEGLAGERGGGDHAHGQSHDDRQIERPEVEGEVVATLDPLDDTRREPLRQQC